ncbi:hypothetical protein [Methylobrevis albus]|uniref:Uncharacterized protein n=1 Tax=Methylobrevis albus TaxID=2793297 RepID=A0A931I2G9_9HYPH|nr:hypothetical protein [Methylobrevis albus]MBH0239025.1 hypothetical protein [Methylobrevis albus]
MTSSDFPASTGPAPPSPLAVLTALSFALVVLTAAWGLVDDRLLQGVPVWSKPLKFAVSFTVLFATLALAEQRLSPAWRGSWTLRLTTAVMAAAMIGEMAYIIAMAAQQTASHYNVATPFTALMYSLMGVGALALVAGVAVFGLAALRDAGARLAPGLRWGIGWGFLLSAGLTLVTAGYMGSAGTHVGTQLAGAATLPLFGWSASVGDIRPAHFLALHAMQVLPLAGLLADRNAIPVHRLRWVALAYTALTAAVFAQALAGLPLVRL